MAVYEFVAYQGSSALGEIAALDVRIDLYLDRPSQLSFKVNGEHPSAEWLTELTNDVVVWRDGVKLARFVILSARDELDGERHWVNVGCGDYRARLEHRIVLTQQTFTAEDDVDIAWDLIDTAQGQTNGGMGITRGVYPAGVSLTGGVAPGVKVREAIDILSDIDDGFDWDIDADLRFNIYRSRGESRQRVLDYGGLVREAQRDFSVTRYANVVRTSGDDTTSPVIVGTGDASVGRWESVAGYPQVSDQLLLAGLAIDEQSRAADEAYAFSVTLRDAEGVQRWGGLGDIGLGDTIRIVMKSGRLDVNEVKRVLEIHVNVGADGAEAVTLTLEGREMTFAQRIDRILRRLDALERN